MEQAPYQTILSRNSSEGDQAGPDPRTPRRLRSALLFFFLTSGAVIVALYMLMLSPFDFTRETIVEIPSGYSVKQIGALLKEKSIIRSMTMFSLFVARDNKERNIPAGQYLFKKPAPVWEVARRFTVGEYGVDTRRVTIPEGMSAREMSEIITRVLPYAKQDDFTGMATAHEGYLFPDTYFFFVTATSGEVVKTMRENFKDKTDLLYQEAISKKMQWSDMIIMASILEREAATPEDRRLVAGILWKRIDRNMPLQVDATFMYTDGKASSEITMDDLQNDSPYNTYRHRGLPPAPIGNPGLDAIDAAMHPDRTNNLYYLSDKDGGMHYARTFEEHKINKEKYLR